MRRFKNISAVRGFTLLEIVVAVAIFAIVISIAFPALIQFLDMRERIEEKHTELSALQKVFLFLGNDLRFAINRTGKDEYGQAEKQSMIINDKNLLEFITLSQDINLQGLAVPRKVIWSLEDGVLSRQQYPVADPDGDTFSYTQSLLEDVEDVSIELNYLEDGKDNRTSKWNKEGRLPDLITIDLTVEGGLNYSRIISLATNAEN